MRASQRQRKSFAVVFGHPFHHSHKTFTAKPARQPDFEVRYVFVDDLQCLRGSQALAPRLSTDKLIAAYPCGSACSSMRLAKQASASTPITQSILLTKKSMCSSNSLPLFLENTTMACLVKPMIVPFILSNSSCVHPESDLVRRFSSPHPASSSFEHVLVVSRARRQQPWRSCYLAQVHPQAR